MNFPETFEVIKTKLTEITGVTDWENLAFTMYPGDPETGYMQPVSVELGKGINTIILMAGIGIAEVSMSLLWEKVLNTIGLLESAFASSAVCADGTSLSLTGKIEINLPDTYIQQGDISETNAFQVAISFQLTAMVGR